MYLELLELRLELLKVLLELLLELLMVLPLPVSWLPDAWY